MKLARLVPRPLVPAARRAYRVLRGRPPSAGGTKAGGTRAGKRPPAEPQVLSRDELHAFWRAPDAVNKPEEYAAAPADRSEFLVALLNRHCRPDDRILEVGTNVGRNLEHLRLAGYRHLEGIEISGDAVRAMRTTYPELAATATIHNAPVEDVIRGLPDAAFGAVFAMAVLEHLHPESDWVFAEMARICGGVVVTIEDEVGRSRHHVPRDYGAVFEGIGMRQVEEIDASGIGGLVPGFRARVFRPAAAGGPDAGS